MKVGMFAVLPAEVRYDTHLTDKSKLLYAEIAAATNNWGIAEDDNAYFAKVLGVDKRTIGRCISQLVDNGHLIRLQEHGKRKLRLVCRGLPMPETDSLKVVTSVDRDELLKDYNNILSFWQTRRNFTYRDEEKATLYNDIRDRLKTFTAEELILALQNRLSFIHQSPWHSAEENVAAADDIRAVLGTDDTVLRWLGTSEQ